MGYYHVAQICLNGHIINSMYDAYPEFNQNFCDKCGVRTITECPHCNSNIKGYYEGSFKFMKHTPSYCFNCGNPYPWTESALKSAQELLELEGVLSKEDLDYFNENKSSLIADTPNSKVVATKLKLFISKVSSSTGSVLKDIIVDVASESVKKIILGS